MTGEPGPAESAVKDAGETRRALVGLLLGAGYGALVGLLVRRDRDADRREGTSWAGASKT